MATDPRRLARFVTARRQELGLSQMDVANRGGPSDTTLSKVEAAIGSPNRQTLRKLDISLGWADGSARRVLEDGGEPEPVVNEPPVSYYDWQRLADHVRRRREEAGLSQAETAIRGALAEDTFARIEAGQRVRHQRVLSALDQAMAWSQGSSERVLKGGDPRPHPGPPPRALSRYEALARAQRSPLRRPARRLTDLTYEDLFDRWARLFAQSLAIEMEYARRRGLSQPGEARDELYEVLVMAELGREGRPWVPPWEEMSDDEAQDHIDALREAGLIDEDGEPIVDEDEDEDEETAPPQPIPEPELDDGYLRDLGAAAREGEPPSGGPEVSDRDDSV